MRMNSTWFSALIPKWMVVVIFMYATNYETGKIKVMCMVYMSVLKQQWSLLELTIWRS